MIRLLVCLATLLALTACQPPVRLMPAPAIFLNEHNLFAANANLDRSAEIQVFYATNRLAFGPSGAPAYTVFPGNDLHLGVATLDIGGGGRSWDWLYEQSTQASAERRPQLLVNSMDRKASVAVGSREDAPGEEALAFFRQIDQALAGSADPDLTIYVHGANTSVGRATAQAAQYRHFTGRNSVVLSFLWPSAENFMRFSHDVSKAGQTAPAFAQLVRMLAQHTRARHINVIAYSSGAMVASPGLAILGTPAEGYDPASVRLGEVYFPAPDADFRQFVSELQVYHGYPRRVTVTVNMHDSVLVLSRVHQRGSRAGRPDPTELSPEDAQWMVEASRRLDFDLLSARAADLPGMERRSHIFWYDHPWVSSDVLLKMLFHFAPEERGLQRNLTADDLEYWTFPEDYEARLDAVMDELVQAAAAQRGETSTQ
ncbi:alpha/beta hydrolase [Pseudoxanthomonas suwonensis]|uniref:Alpha/beta hydrolase n=1 Tax=Pseudoxanthomonas suwonensis TaxID=314722 RepID=A0A0E3YZH2_9GAMM|nr:alpha/beta hydrolase [Pseudoxanthomonas suwonensis]AKC85493.1 hypothetical protein WQ53_00610 [Pseudoxanthomonas suwonensis]